jgi:hypothetical protein
MLLKFLFWVLAFYALGSWLARVLRGLRGQEEDVKRSEMGGTGKSAPPPYDPDDVVDAQFHDSKPSREKTEGEDT